MGLVLFGLTDEQFEKIENGDFLDFAVYYGDQVNRNYFMDRLSDPCDKDYDLFENKEKGFAPMLVDVIEIINADGGLIH